ncbi:MAG: InlB B-repeat-containing protein [Treponema sp.]|nr:InlB B-repeat-containing protein [Treponema sp.]
MNIKKRFFLGAALLISVLFLGCSLATEKETDEENGGVRVQLNIGFARTVMPSGFLNATYTLTGTHSGESTVLIKDKSALDLQKQTVWLEGGTWSFTLDAYNGSTKIATATLSDQTISSSSTTLTFTFSGVTFDYASGTGGTNVTLTFSASAQVAAATAQLYNADGTENGSYALTALTPATYSDSLQCVTFTNTSIASGSYLLVFYLYQDAEKTMQIGQWREIVNIADGCESSAVINIPNLNTVYTITYVLNGLAWADGFTAPSSFNASQGVTLPVAANFADGADFAGWYAASDFSGTAVTSFAAGDYATNVTFYAKVEKTTGEVDWTYPTAAPTLTWTGEGTLNNPYVITTSQQLADFAYMVNNGTTYSGNYITLGADIDLNYGSTVTDASASYSQWKPIGGSSYAFQGSFDGNSHTVKGLYINSSCSYAGLFGSVSSSSAVVQNVTVQGYMKVTNGYYVGGVVGEHSSGKLVNCANKVEIIATMGSGSKYGCGGVVGYQYSSSLKNCVNYSNINANMTASYTLNVGGVCGYNDCNTISSCENYGDVTGTSSSVCIVGGIVGYAYSTSIYNSISSGAIKGKAGSTSYTGGVFGNTYSTYAENNAFYGTVDGSGTSIYLRGIGYASTASATYQGCNYFISTSGATASSVGGFVGTFTLATDQITAYGSTTLDYTGTLLEVLNAWASANSSSSYSTWKAGTDGWPVLSDITWTK